MSDKQNARIVKITLRNGITIPARIPVLDETTIRSPFGCRKSFAFGLSQALTYVIETEARAAPIIARDNIKELVDRLWARAWTLASGMQRFNWSSLIGFGLHVHGNHYSLALPLDGLCYSASVIAERSFLMATVMMHKNFRITLPPNLNELPRTYTKGAQQLRAPESFEDILSGTAVTDPRTVYCLIDRNSRATPIYGSVNIMKYSDVCYKLSKRFNLDPDECIVLEFIRIPHFCNPQNIRSSFWSSRYRKTIPCPSSPTQSLNTILAMEVLRRTATGILPMTWEITPYHTMDRQYALST